MGLHSLTHTHTHNHTHSQLNSLLSIPPAHLLSLSHTHTHTHTHTHRERERDGGGSAGAASLTSGWVREQRSLTQLLGHPQDALPQVGPGRVPREQGGH